MSKIPERWEIVKGGITDYTLAEIFFNKKHEWEIVYLFNIETPFIRIKYLSNGQYRLFYLTEEQYWFLKRPIYHNDLPISLEIIKKKNLEIDIFHPFKYSEFGDLL